MNNPTPNNLRRVIFKNAAFIGIVAVLGLVCFSVLRYPASLGQNGLTNFLIVVCALLGYGGVVLWVQHKPSGLLKIALRQGALFGMLFGVVSIANISVEYLIALDGSARAVLGIGYWGLMFLLLSIPGSTTYRKSGSIKFAILASLWSAILGITIAVLYGFLFALLFLPYMEEILRGAFLQSGMADPQAFVVSNTLLSAMTHIVIAPCVAVLLGFVGSFVSAILKPLHRNIIVGLGIVDLVLGLGGLLAIQVAISLDRSARPPYIRMGLLALGIALACATPVLAALRHTVTEQPGYAAKPPNASPS